MNTVLLDPISINLSPGHPGEGDPGYIARRLELSRLVASMEEGEVDPPGVQHSESEVAVWRAIMDRLASAHETYAASSYREGFRRLGLSPAHPPAPGDLARRLKQQTGFGLILTDGLLDARVFLAHLGNRVQPCTVYLRHGSRPDYTPEPDLVHEAIGHAPLLTNPDAARLNEVIGSAAATATARQLEALLRLYWFTLEFGLVEEKTGLRAYGAGLLSSFGELPHAFKDAVDRRPFNLHEAIEQPYAHDRMQDVLFVAPSLRIVLDEVERWLGGSEYAGLL